MGPQLGATFVPGGFDDYYMPEVVAPSPQRYVSLFKYVDVPTRRRHRTHRIKWRSGTELAAAPVRRGLRKS